jgi:hypothetical protein
LEANQLHNGQAMKRRQPMYRIVFLALLAGGGALIIYWISASQLLNSDISRLFSAPPIDKTIWMLVGGTILSIAGMAGLLNQARSTA